jgi:hypothetical protein
MMPATAPAPTKKNTGEILAYRFCTPDQNSSTAQVRRSFAQPFDAVAISTAGDDADLQIVCCEDSAETAAKWRAWLSQPGKAGPVLPITMEIGTTRIHWRPGRAVIAATAVDSQELIDALLEFSFFESELARLESEIEPHQRQASSDVDLAYDIKPADRAQWPRLYRTMETLQWLRLRFARLEPCLYQTNRGLPAMSRRLIRQLRARADIEARSEALSDRIESCEDLYEGAVDRITDHRNYRREHFLEIAIVVLLVVEVVLLLIHRG